MLVSSNAGLGITFSNTQFPQRLNENQDYYFKIHMEVLPVVKLLTQL